MTKTYYTSRSQAQDYRRCPRLRWLSHYEGQAGMGLEPKRKSLHLVIGSAVHAGMEVLLREGQRWLDSNPTLPGPNDMEMSATLDQQLEYMFVQSAVTTDGKPIARRIENMAVEAALADLAKEFGEGVELDPEEAAARQVAQQLAADGGQSLLQSSRSDAIGRSALGGISTSSLDSPIMITFDGLIQADLTDPTSPAFERLSTPIPSAPVYEGIPRAAILSDEEYLRKELAALVEGMVRTWARRRWRATLEQFEVLEVEREGEWRLAEFRSHAGLTGHSADGNDCDDYCQHAEVRFQSRHDALLLERSTSYLYLQSYKTTGKWDRRKEMDAQVDMQGLTEAVDVERRLGEAWNLLHNPLFLSLRKDFSMEACLAMSGNKAIAELVSTATASWLSTLPDPPRILGIRYDYLLKGDRKRDKKNALAPDRYVFESVLCRAWKQEGITSDDRRWSWTYTWHDQTGKERRLPWQSWQKAAVWEVMPIADWIDQLDSRRWQEDALTENGEEMDPLAEQLLPIIVVYRNEDDARDCIEQLAAQEEKVARDVEEVRRAAAEGEGEKRSALNRLFPQNRSACSYPGLCQYRSTPTKPGLCFAGSVTVAEAEASGEFRERRPNHPLTKE